MKNLPDEFSEIIAIIYNSRNNALQSVNKELINLYYTLGKYITERIVTSAWGTSVVTQLAVYIKTQEPDLKGYSDKNLWRMKQFYESYNLHPNLSPLVREISWTHNLLILSKTKTIEEKEFYLRLAIKEKYTKRELERQLNSAYYERVILAKPKLSPAVREFPKDISGIFRDTYMFEFLNIKEEHSEADLQRALVKNLKSFILELGKDFIFIDEQYRLQVGNHDYFIDLLFYHRELSCLVAFELKIEEFAPAHLGQLNFYLEALDRDVKKQHENPSIGVLICKTKDAEVVEYALSRNLSPALVAEYETKLMDRKLLALKVHELFDNGNKDQ